MDGRTVVVSGAAGGIGAAVARRFAAAGATLVLGDLNAVALEDARRRAGGAHHGARAHLRRQRAGRLREPHGHGGRRRRPRRRRRQRGRRLDRGPQRPDHRGGVGQGPRRQSQGHLLLLPLRDPAPQEDRGLHRQSELRRRGRRHAGDGRLHGLQGRREPAHQVAGPRARPGPGALRRRVPGRRHDAHARGPGARLRRRRPRGLLQAPAGQLPAGRQGALHHARAGRRAHLLPRRAPRRRPSPGRSSASTTAPPPATATSDACVTAARLRRHDIDPVTSRKESAPDNG